MNADTLSIIILVIIFTLLMNVFYLVPYWSAKKKFDKTMRLCLSKSSKKFLMIASLIVVSLTILAIPIAPVMTLVPPVLGLVLLYSNLVYIGDTHVYQNKSCLILSKIKHARVEGKNGRATKLTFKYRNEHLQLNVGYTDIKYLLDRIKG